MKVVIMITMLKTKVKWKHYNVSVFMDMIILWVFYINANFILIFKWNGPCDMIGVSTANCNKGFLQLSEYLIFSRENRVYIDTYKQAVCRSLIFSGAHVYVK